jgi:hypothetical protein
MRSIANALNNIASAIRSLSTIVAPVKDVRPIEQTTITSNPTKSNVTITSVTQLKENPYDSWKKEYTPKKQFERTSPKLVHVSKSEKDAIDSIYKAITNKGVNPKHHDKMMKQLSEGWPVLYSALMQIVSAHKEYYNEQTPDIWKSKNKW